MKTLLTYNNFKIVLVLLFINITVIMKSQIIVDMSSNVVLPPHYNQTGQYCEKDVHNYLDNFVGTWEYTNGTEKFQIILTKIIKYHKNMPKIKLNFYEDGIAVRYKKYMNGILIFESPSTNKPTFSTYDGNKLEGYMVDFGRITVDVNWPSSSLLNLGVLKHGGEYFHPSCTIEKLPLSFNEPEKIKFNLYLGETSGFGSEYNNPAYAGQPTFSIPNNVIMTKLP